MTRALLAQTNSSVAFWAALAGAAVGGFASAVGSIWVERRKLTRDARIRLFDELIPRCLGPQPSGGSLERASLEQLHRAARMSGRRDRCAADRILALFDEQQAIYREEYAEFKARNLHGESLVRTTEARRNVTEALEKFGADLGDRIR